MKIALITDSHHGIRNDNHIITENSKKFFDNIFFPRLKEENIKTVVHLGDLVDRRKYINYYTASRLRQDLIEPLINDFDFHWILGNHDLYFKNTLEVSAASELFNYYPNTFKYYTKSEEVDFQGTKILFVPWICDENREKTNELINTSQAKILFGHLELVGFEMFKGVVAHHGENPNIFSKFEIVCSGHYHHKSSLGNIHYLGAHSEFNWSDFGDDRGFHIFDVETQKLDFIRNPYNLFAKIFYNDADGREFDFTTLKDKFVKIVVLNRNNTAKYEWFIDQVEEAQPIEYSIVDDHLNIGELADSSIINESQDTLTIILNYAKSINCSANTIKLDSLFMDLYNQAQGVE